MIETPIKTLYGRVIVCGTEGTNPDDVADATAGALYDWARGIWGPLDIELCNEEGQLVATRTVDSKHFRPLGSAEQKEGCDD